MTEAPYQTHFAGQNGAAVAGAPEDPPFTVLPIDMRGRRWIVGDDAEAVFARDGGRTGTSVTIELKTDAEARAVLQALLWQATEG